jgi:solute:Na+ symporter, SSS family
VVDVAVMVAVSLATRPKSETDLLGLVWGLTKTEDVSARRDPAERAWWRRPEILGSAALVITVVLYLVFVL